MHTLPSDTRTRLLQSSGRAVQPLAASPLRGICLRTGFSTADYLFFNTVLAATDVVCHTTDATVARIDVSGVSAGLQTISQKYAIDHLFGRSGRMKLLAVLALHPAYYGVKRWLRGAR